MCSTGIVVWRRQFIVAAIETLSATLLKDDAPGSQKGYGKTVSKTIFERSSTWNLRERVLEYEVHFPDDNFHTR